MGGGVGVNLMIVVRNSYHATFYIIFNKEPFTIMVVFKCFNWISILYYYSFALKKLNHTLRVC